MDMVYATTLYITLIENNLGRIDQILPYILEEAYSNIVNIKKSNHLKVVNIEVIAIAIWYNP